MKVGSKRRRTKQEILDDKAKAEAKAAAIDEKLALLDNLLQENAQLKAAAGGESEAERILSQMLAAGHVHRGPDGNWNPGPAP